MTDSPSNDFLDDLALDWANGKVTIAEALRVALIKGFDKGWVTCEQAYDRGAGREAAYVEGHGTGFVAGKQSYAKYLEDKE